MTDKLDNKTTLPYHLGIIMDGNGRWAQARGLPRSAGHTAGIETIRRTINSCVELGIHVLTLYTFSTENWTRPAEEVSFIMRLIEKHINEELPELHRNGVHIQLMGERQGLPKSLVNALDTAAEVTKENSSLILNLALNYGGRKEIIYAVKSILAKKRDDPTGQCTVDEKLIADHLYCPECPDVDLIIRTGGEWRLSNFMTWRAANTVFWNTSVFWPDFNRKHLIKAFEIYTAHVQENE